VFGKPYTTRDGARVNLPFTEASPSPKSSPFGMPGPAGTHLVNAYSISKWEQEQLVWKAHRDLGLPVIVVRPGPMYGPGSSYGHGGIILAMARGLVRGIPAASKHYINSSVHVEDVARFACFIADAQAIGEDYNVVDSSVISYHEFLHYVALLVGRRLRDLWLPLGLAKLIFLLVVHLWTWLERTFGVPRLRVIEPQSAVYIGSSYWISNRKALASGFSYRYADVRQGLIDTVTWMRDVGWLYSPDAKKRRALLLAPRPKRAPAPAPPPQRDATAPILSGK